MQLPTWRIAKIEDQLLARFGAVIGGADLRHLLGYRTGSAFRQAVHRKTLPVRTFLQPNKRGRCASSAEVAVWMASLQSDDAVLGALEGQDLPSPRYGFPGREPTDTLPERL